MKKKPGFSLIEMMVVLLIVAIVAAATTPMITKKLSRNANISDNPWLWLGLGNNIGYNLGGDNRIAIIGSNRYNPNGGVNSPRLVLSGGDGLAFAQNNGNFLGRIRMTANSVAINDTNNINANSVVVGQGATSTANGVAVGQGAGSADSGVAVGQSASTTNANSIAIGNTASATQQWGIAIGRLARAFEQDAIAIGRTATSYALVPSGDAYAEDASNDHHSGVAIGAGACARGHASTALGALAEANGYTSVALGHSAIADGGTNLGLGNTVAIGHKAKAQAVRSIAIGNENTVSGTNSIAIGRNITLKGNNSIVIDTNTNTIENNNTIRLGNSSHLVQIPGEMNTWGYAHIGQGLGVSGEDSMGHGLWVLKSALFSDDVTIIGTLFNRSDRRLKNVGEEFTGGLEELKKLQLFHYTFKDDEKKTPRVGVMAQDLQKIFPNAVTKNEDGYLQIRKEDMFYALINAVKELDKKIANVVKKVTANVEEIANLKTTVENQQKTIEELQKQNDDLIKRLEKLEKMVK